MKLAKTYTTAEMIDKLDIGQNAEMVEPVQDIVVRSNSNGIIVLKDALSTKHIGQPLPLSRTVMNAKWRLERKEITFGQAVDFIHKGKAVTCDYEDISTTYDSLNDLIHIAEAINGKWYMEE